MSASFVDLQFEYSEQSEKLQALLLMHDPLGFFEDDDCWHCYFNRQHWIDRVAQILLTEIRAAFPDTVFALKDLEKRNWNKDWEDSITPVRASERFIIAPSWNAQPEEDGAIVLIIDPKMSFGTGYHATTRLMLRLLERRLRPGDRVLDVGAGTGVLSIAAALLGAGRAVGVDTDEWAYENALENLERNRVAEKVEMHLGSIEHAAGVFDLVLANITLADNIRFLPEFRKFIAPGSRLALSGFYTSDLDAFRSAASDSGFRIVEEISEEEWSAVLLEPETISLP